MSDGFKFVDELPPLNRGGRGKDPRIDARNQALRERPGQWAEIARYPGDRQAAANSKATHIRRRDPDIEVKLRKVGDEYVVFARATPGGTR